MLGAVQLNFAEHVAGVCSEGFYLFSAFILGAVRNVTASVGYTSKAMIPECCIFQAEPPSGPPAHHNVQVVGVAVEFPEGQPMRHSLHSHIIYLENTIQDMRNRLTRRGLPVEEVEDLELQLSLAESALTYYRQGYALELAVTGAEPPPASAEGEPKASKASTKDSKPENNNAALPGRRRIQVPRHTRFQTNRVRQRSAATCA